MRYRIIALALAAALAAAAPSGDLGEVVAADNAFAVDLYQRLARTPGNMVCSPYSIVSALAMVHAGARGRTELDMARVMRLSLSPDRLHPARAALAGDLAGRGNVDGLELVLANRLWGQAGYPFEVPWRELLRSHYGADLGLADFRTAPEEARRAINAWASEKTNGRIEELLPEAGVGRDDRLVLVSAAYFKGDWKYPFDPDRTNPEGRFLVSPSREVRVPMMSQKTVFEYGRGPGLALLALPYAGGDLALVVALPDKVSGLAELEKRLSAEDLDRWLADMSQAEVEVYLPRFTVASEFDLAKPLRDLGMGRAFDNRADFTGTARPEDEPGLFLGLVVQKAFIEVNERGTEAGAATAAGMRMANGGKTFRADRPFLYLIRDRQTGAVLFMGRVVDPGGAPGPGRD